MEIPRTFRLDPDKPDHSVLKEAAAVLLQGGLVVLPTETVYGLAADPELADAMEKLFHAKGREKNKPVARFSPNVSRVVESGAELGPAARVLVEQFWPGSLTLVLSTKSGPMGFRVPDHAVPLGLLREAGRLLAVTSANRSGGSEARTAAEAVEDLGGAVELVLDGGPTGDRAPSTVVRAIGSGLEILREGAIARDDIEAALAGMEVCVS